MIYASHQLNFLPYAGFWNKVAYCDVFGASIHEQFVKGDYTNRVKIGVDNEVWLTIPVTHKNREPLKNVLISDVYNPKSVMSKLDLAYKKSRNWKAIRPLFKEKFYSFRGGDKLHLLNEELFYLVYELLGLSTQVVNEEEPNCNHTATEKLIWYTKASDCNVYLSGDGGKSYLNEEIFKEDNIELLFSSSITPKIKTGFNSQSVLNHIAYERAL